MIREERLDDLEESIRIALDSRASQIWTAIPAIVQSVNLTAQTVTATPSVQAVITREDGSQEPVTLPLLVDVPICWPRGGGYVLTFPVSAGDEVLIIFSKSCIDSWWQSGGVQPPAEIRSHDISDGIAILAPTSQPKRVPSVSPSAVELRSLDGSAGVSISPSAMTLRHPVGIVIDAPSMRYGIIDLLSHTHNAPAGGGLTSGPQP